MCCKDVISREFSQHISACVPADFGIPGRIHYLARRKGQANVLPHVHVAGEKAFFFIKRPDCRKPPSCHF